MYSEEKQVDDDDDDDDDAAALSRTAASIVNKRRRERQKEFAVYDPALALPRFCVYFGTVPFRNVQFYIMQQQKLRQKAKRKQTHDSDSDDEEVDRVKSLAQKLTLARATLDSNRAMLTSLECPSAEFIAALGDLGDFFVDRVKVDNNSNVDATFDAVMEVFADVLADNGKKMKRSEILIWHIERILSSACMSVAGPRAAQRRNRIRSHPFILDTIRSLIESLSENESLVQQYFCLVANAHFDAKLPDSVMRFVAGLWSKAEEEISTAFACAVFRNHIANKGDMHSITSVHLRKVGEFLTKYAINSEWWLSNICSVICYYQSDSSVIKACDAMFSASDMRDELVEMSKMKDARESPAWKYFWWYLPNACSDATVNHVANMLPKMDEYFYPLCFLQSRSKSEEIIPEAAMRKIVDAIERHGCSGGKKQLAEVLLRMTTNKRSQFITEEKLKNWSSTKLGEGKIVASTVDM